MGAQWVCSHCPGVLTLLLSHTDKGLFTQQPPGRWEWKLEVCFLPVLSFCLSVSVEVHLSSSVPLLRGMDQKPGRGWREPPHWI